MSNKKSVVFGLVTLMTMQIAGCAISRAPKGRLPDPGDRQSLTYGGWLSVRFADSDFGWDAEGELIAVANDSLYVLTDSYRFMAISLKKIAKAQMTAYNIKAGRLGVWALLGVLSTPSHGFILVLSTPLWLLVGVIPTAVQSYTPRIKYPSKTWDEFRKFARFPQGLPEGFARGIRPKINNSIRN